MAIRLEGKICLVTGANKGVGRGIVQGFIERGASVVAGVRNPADSKDSPITHVVRLDVTKEEEIEAAIAEIVAQYGRIDVLINNAGVYPRTPAEQLTQEDWKSVLDVNLDGSWKCARAVIPFMKNQQHGVIINVGSVTLRLGGENLAHYNASKGGIVGLTRGLARDLGRYGIRVNCLHLGAVLVEREKELFLSQEAILATLNKNQSIPGRLTPASVEPVFAFFASDESSDITGQCLTVDRGWVHD